VGEPPRGARRVLPPPAARGIRSGRSRARVCGAALDVQATAIEELRTRLVTDPAPDENLLAALASQTDAVRRQDRQYGAGRLLEQMRCTSQMSSSTLRALPWTQHVVRWRMCWPTQRHSPRGRPWTLARLIKRGASSTLLVRSAAGGGRSAVRVCATGAGPRPRRSRISAQRADLATSTWESHHRQVSPAVRCWLAAAVAEMLAAAHESQAARAMIATAEGRVDALTGERPSVPRFRLRPPDRWIGHSLVLLGDPEAQPRLRTWPTRWTRRSSVPCRAAPGPGGLAAARQRLDEARAELSIAERMARKVGSRRQLERARSLRATS
jgi:hypothetical protein